MTMTTASSVGKHHQHAKEWGSKRKDGVLELLLKRGMDADVDFLREALKVLADGIMEPRFPPRNRAGYGERTPQRITHRDGCRTRA